MWVLVLDCVSLLVAIVLVPPGGWFSAAVLVTAVLLLNVAGAQYRDPVTPSVLDQLPSLTGRALVAGGVTVIVGGYHDSRVHAETAVAFVVLASAGRALGFALLRRWRRGHQAGRPTIIVGAGPLGRRLAVAMLEHPECGRRPVGFVDDDRAALGVDSAALGLDRAVLPMLGDVASLPALIADAPGCDAIVADCAAGEARMVETLQRCDRLPGEIYVVPRLHEIHASEGTETAWGFPLVRLRRAAHRTLSWRLKRVVDVASAGVMLFLLLPLIAVCAVLVLIEGGPRVIFRQERIGMDGRAFPILKFRTLSPVDRIESAQLWSIKGDPRLGPFGKMLRTMSLDELPQLWNVIRGDMSMVGPRPERPYFVGEFSRLFPHYAARHRVPAGLTGWAQISGLRGDTDISERARLDNGYIANWSLWNDVKIMVRTAGNLVSRAGS